MHFRPFGEHLRPWLKLPMLSGALPRQLVQQVHGPSVEHPGSLLERGGPYVEHFGYSTMDKHSVELAELFVEHPGHSGSLELGRES